VVVLVFSAVCFSQLPSSRCDSSKSALEDCTFLTPFEPVQDQIFTSKSGSLDRSAVPAESSEAATNRMPSSTEATIASMPPRTEGFHWRRALTESFTFLVIEQAYVVHTDFNWVVSENGVPFNHYWRDYMQSLSTWTHSGWNDGDPNWFGYVGHPIQGALTGFIQIQNDPRSEKLEFSRTKAYWWSRFKAGLWNAAYSTQWNLGPVSEVTVEKYGTKDRPPNTYAGIYPCFRHCLTGVGQIDIVMTPLGGTGWLIGEDFLDQKVVRRVESSTRNPLLIDAARVALNPIRAGANMLHGEHPWYRASRGTQEMNHFEQQTQVASTQSDTRTQAPNLGDVFFGYSHTGASHCETLSSGTAITCDPFSVKNSGLSGWNVSLEKKYLHYFGAVADVGGEYGGVSQSNFLVGLRGGAWAGRFRPFGQVLFGAVHAPEVGSNTSFAEDLGLGIDFRLTRLLSWRNQVDVLKTGTPDFERRNLRPSSGFAVRF